jgi:CheY-like chemotaxis protein
VNANIPYILIVDDDEDAQEIFRQIAESLDIISVGVRDGVEALEAVREAPPALILLDLIMPHMNGFEVLSELRGNPGTQNIPVIIVSAVESELLIKIPGVEDNFSKAALPIAEMKNRIAAIMSCVPA